MPAAAPQGRRFSSLRFHGTFAAAKDRPQASAAAAMAS